MPGVVNDEPAQDGATKDRVALVICFDGTGNQYSGDESDTNIVKIYSMLKKHTPGQYHYYQPGIGTYTQGQSTGEGGIKLFPGTRNKVWSIADEGFGLTFVDHVLGGYEFIMRYYAEHNDIYIFGFSRGAYAARFLAEMIWKIGLLAKGNEEMVHFAWRTFSKFQETRGDNSSDPKKTKEELFMDSFRNTFCRPNIRVHFLGLFDCVNSVGQFEVPMFRKSYENMAQPAARHIRHAVSIHERRTKFKPALFFFTEEDKKKIDFKEVWFAGNHGDVGGGWGFEGKDPQEPWNNTDEGRWTDGRRHLLSDTPLNWMIQEVTNLQGSKSQLVFDEQEMEGRKNAEKLFLKPDELVKATAVDERNKASLPHDMLKFNHGAKWYMVFVWWLIESLPFFTRLELENNKWVPRHWPPNLGAPRDLPGDAVLHESVQTLFEAKIIDEMPSLGGNNSHFKHTEQYLRRAISGPVPTRSNMSAASNGHKGHDENTPLIKKGKFVSNGV